MAEYLGREENKDTKEVGNTETKDDIRKRKKEESDNVDATKEEERQMKYKKAIKKAKTQSANLYASSNVDEEYDEIEAAIMKQKLITQTGSGARKTEEERVQALTAQKATPNETIPISAEDKDNEKGNVLLTDSYNFINAVASAKDIKRYKKR